MFDRLLSLSDVADLAHVRRATVSVWRSRSASEALPFPRSKTTGLGQDLFDAHDIVEWLAATGRGNNPDAALDVTSFGWGSLDPAVFEALFALRVHAGQDLTDMADPMHRARELDGDDVWVLSEVESACSELQDAIAQVDAVGAAAFDAGQAFEQVRRRRPSTSTRTELAPRALALVADLALVLAGGTASGRFLDPTGVASALLVEIAQRAGEGGDIEVLLGRWRDDRQADAPRSTCRRLAAHSIPWRWLRSDEVHAGRADSVLVAQLPHELAPETGLEAVLDSIGGIIAGMPGAQRGVIIAPAAALCDAMPSAATNARRMLLRDGRVRAVIRLPAGLLPAHPRQALAIWVLGPPTADVAPRSRWTMIADLGEGPLNVTGHSDLVGDVFASVGAPADIPAHAFRFGRIERSSTLIARDGSLVARPAAASRPSSVSLAVASAAALRVGELLDLIGEAAPPRLAAEPAPDLEAVTMPSETIASLMARGAIKYRSGTRLEEGGIGESGHVVLGLPELLGGRLRGVRRFGILEFERAHGRSRRTSPGDVVFSTSPLVAAVDREGGSIVEHPVRVLSITAQSRDLVPDLLAADINARAPGSVRWRDWAVRRVPPDRVPALAQASSLVAELRAATEERLRAIDELDALLMEGAVSGTLHHPRLLSPHDPLPSNTTATHRKAPDVP
ncbi:hypothetical protein C5B94_08065 [Clavibacter michiganensis]|uniref:hypothetical protein n=1 Tax=Clavibacter michiganensis TaxID=28447 RepID=UPI000CE76918|nr:hypothetical protein [Clavibacter michiganensis]PPF54301.1 hypothetical protein C5B94_08065 [Clavibacter michiganensis]